MSDAVVFVILTGTPVRPGLHFYASVPEGGPDATELVRDDGVLY